MIEFIALLPAYSSYFELAVAFNFSYAASDSLRSAIKSGFLHRSRRLAELVHADLEELQSRLTVQATELGLGIEKKKKIINLLKNRYQDLRKTADELSETIESEQARVTTDSKPVHVFLALISLIFLFLAGQESVHQIFPRNEVLAILVCSTIYLIIFYGFNSYRLNTNVISSSFFAILIVVLAVLTDLGGLIDSSFTTLLNNYDYSVLIKNKYLVDYSIVLVMLSFLFTALRLLFINSYLSFSYKIKVALLMRKINVYRKALNDMRESAKVLNNLEQE